MSRRLLLACAFAALPAIVATPALATCPSDEAISRLADAMAAGRLEDPFQGLSLTLLRQNSGGTKPDLVG